MNPLKKRMIATPKLKGPRLEQLQLQVQNIRLKLRDIGGYDEIPAETLSIAER